MNPLLLVPDFPFDMICTFPCLMNGRDTGLPVRQKNDREVNNCDKIEAVDDLQDKRQNANVR